MPRKPLTPIFAGEQMVDKPYVLLSGEQELEWYRRVKSLPNIEQRIETMRILLTEAYQLWRDNVHQDVGANGQGRIKLYSLIQGAAIAANAAAKTFRQIPEVAEGNDLAHMERIIRHIIDRKNTTHKDEWPKVLARFREMFDDLSPEGMLLFIKQSRAFKESVDGYSKLEYWLQTGSEGGHLPDPSKRMPSERLIHPDDFDQRRPDEESFDPA